MTPAIRHYLVVTLSYWTFTVTDGALRMLVVLHFHQLGYSALEVAMLFLFYEFFGVVTNLVGGWLGARFGLSRTLYAGLAIQVLALAMLTVPAEWLTVVYVMAAQALSGIAKDLNKMSAKSSVKLLVREGEDDRLFRRVAALTGSKNALKGVGFFLGGLLLSTVGFRAGIGGMAAGVGVILVISLLALPSDLGRSRAKAKFRHLLSKSRPVNVLSAARFFLFGARDIWFVVALPVYLQAVLGWSFTAVGTFLAVWVIGYGLVQTITPRLVRNTVTPRGGDRRAAVGLALALVLATLAIPAALHLGWPPGTVLVAGLAAFGVLFALNSSLHSWLIVAYADREGVSLDVGFYYMANAGGRLVGTVLSGALYTIWDLEICLAGSAAFALASALIVARLPKPADDGAPDTQRELTG